MSEDMSKPQERQTSEVKNERDRTACAPDGGWWWCGYGRNTNFAEAEIHKLSNRP